LSREQQKRITSSDQRDAHERNMGIQGRQMEFAL
jgi:hypothetical protein